MKVQRSRTFDFRLDPASAEERYRIPPALRAEIDARVAAGRVTICPPCTFAQPEWAPDEGPGVVSVEVAPGKVVRAGGGWRGKRPGVAERRARILKLADGTRDLKAIAAEAGCHFNTVRADIAAMRLQGLGPRFRGEKA